MQVLREYSILDTLPEEEFEDITRIASAICDTPISLITLVDSDRQWFKSNRGLEVTETPRDLAFCAHAINAPHEIFHVKDSRKDDRFADNPLVTGAPHVIFYAGVPLVNPEGFALGTLCVIDEKPRELDEVQLQSLRSLSNQVSKLLELKRVNRKLEESQAALNSRYEELKKFSYVVSHDLKSPLNNIIQLTQILRTSLAGKVNREGEEILGYLTRSSTQLKDLVDGIINHYMRVNASVKERTSVDIEQLFQDLASLIDPRKESGITWEVSSPVLETHAVSLKQILMNLITNAIKYNDKEKAKIHLTFSETPEFYRFAVIDNGKGMDTADIPKIFEPFTTLQATDRFENVSTGIGLATVKQLIEKLDGEIEVTSEKGRGSEFRFTIRK